jgi:hypothetical protein
MRIDRKILSGILNNGGSFLFAGLGSKECGELPSEGQDFVSLEISERFLSSLSGV